MPEALTQAVHELFVLPCPPYATGQGRSWHAFLQVVVVTASTHSMCRVRVVFDVCLQLVLKLLLATLFCFCLCWETG